MAQIAYFDNAATTFPKPESVYTFTDEFYRECGVNVGRGQHLLAAKASALLAGTRKKLCDLCHCQNKSVVFTHTATEALNLILRGIGINNGYNVYITPFEHNSIIRTLHHLSNLFSLKIHTLAFDIKCGKYDLEKITKQFKDNPPNVVMICHASNVCGVIAPISEICKLSKSYNAINVIDMCQTMGLIDTDLSLNTIDYAVFAGHKTLYAPFGIAGFICNPNIRLEPLIYGGTGTDSANPEMPDTFPERYEAGSQNIMAIAGLNAALDWINDIGIENIYNQEQQNRERLLDMLNEYDNIKIILPFSESIGVVSCLFDDYSSDSIGMILSEHNVAVRTGLHCSPNAHKLLGTYPAGTVRFSVSYFNNDEDFAYLDNALNYIYENN
jgi:cysteine desulfurase family protein